MKQPVAIVVAYGENRVIGVEGGLPWHLRSDLKHFKALTVGCPLIMGRKTFESIGKPLPNRETIILTRNKEYRPEGTTCVSTLEEALSVARQAAHRMDSPRIVIAGGGEIYHQALPFVDQIFATQVAASPAGDTVFPILSANEWQETERAAHKASASDDHDFICITYRKL